MSRIVIPTIADWDTVNMKDGLLFVDGNLAELVRPWLWDDCVLGMRPPEYRDYSRNGNNGSSAGGTVTTKSDSFHTDGTAYVTVPDSASLDVKNLSVSFWVKTTDGAGENRRYFIAHTPGAGTSGFAYNKENAANFHRYFVGVGATLYQVEWTDATVFDGKWHHICLYYDGSTMEVFRDGISQASSSAPSGDLDAPAKPLNIGEFSDGTGTGLTADFDFVQVYGRAQGSNELFEQVDHQGAAWECRILPKSFRVPAAPPAGAGFPYQLYYQQGVSL